MPTIPAKCMFITTLITPYTPSISTTKHNINSGLLRSLPHRCKCNTKHTKTKSMANKRTTFTALTLLLSCATLPLLVSPNLQDALNKAIKEKSADFANLMKSLEGGDSAQDPAVQQSMKPFNQREHDRDKEHEPEEPDEPDEPGEPEEHGTKPAEPNKPAEPKKPAEPNKPAEPKKPAEPENKPAKPANQAIKGVDPKAKGHDPGVKGPQPPRRGGPPQPTPGVLKEGFYQKSCPQAEQIVKDVVLKNFQKDPTLAPSLVRLFFHDCFITGCDASNLLDRTPTREPVEKTAPQNGRFVRGYEVIDQAKVALEAKCPGVVSCADALAFTNRESLVYSGLPQFPVASGRRDSKSSIVGDAEAGLPIPESTAQQMIDLFQARGYTIEEMVVMAGAHSIGSAHCTLVSGRFRNPQKWAGVDSGFIMKMQVMSACDNVTQDIAFDPYSQQKLDSRYYTELLKKRALMESDHNLAVDPRTNVFMTKYVGDQPGWLAKFTEAIKKLGTAGVLTGNQGEVRRQCRAVN